MVAYWLCSPGELESYWGQNKREIRERYTKGKRQSLGDEKKEDRYRIESEMT